MKKILLTLVASVFILSGTAFAFHGGGVAHCDGCHSMHNSPDNPRQGVFSAAYLLKGTDPSSTCLNCHGPNRTGSYHVLSDTGVNTNQGGDFFWMLSTSIYDVNVRGDLVNNVPENQGHNVVAFDFGLEADSVNSVSPGGNFDATTFGCDSCHDPHGQVGDNGTLAGTANLQPPISDSGSYGDPDPTDGSILGNYRLLEDSFAAAPIATASNSAGSSVAYGSGMSAWCIGCHDTYGDAFKHPTDASGFTDVYNSYVATGNFTGTVATAYDGMVPFERPTVARADLDPASTAGSTTGSEVVMCLSCHRAHGSAFSNAMRWDPNVEMLYESHILNEATTTLVSSGAVPYYADGAGFDPTARYGQWQRSLCNKCHVKD